MEGGHFLQVKKECLRALCMYARADLCTVDVSHSTRMHRVHGVREMKHTYVQSVARLHQN